MENIMFFPMNQNIFNVHLLIRVETIFRIENKYFQSNICKTIICKTWLFRPKKNVIENGKCFNG